MLACGKVFYCKNCNLVAYSVATEQPLIMVKYFKFFKKLCIGKRSYIAIVKELNGNEHSCRCYVALPHGDVC